MTCWYFPTLLFFSLFIPSSSLFSGTGPDTHGSFLLGETLEFAVGMGKINKHVGKFWNLPKHSMSGNAVKEKKGLHTFLHQSLLIIFIHLFSHSQAKFTCGLRIWPLIPHGKQRHSLRCVSWVCVCLHSNGGVYSGLFLPARTACF